MGMAVSVVLCTYNRADRLTLALDPLLRQKGGVEYEVVLVDNNSTDHTVEVARATAERSSGRVHYVFEPRQGLSQARNRGIEVARGSIIAFTDDDVRVGEDWVARIARAFDDHPEIDYVGGRVLPHWLQKPPRWLTTAHWSPLALQDYGSERFTTGRDRAVCLVGANLAFRRRVFDRVGDFAPELGRIKDGIGSTEDHDMQLRIWRAGMRGLYDPAITVLADVTPDRMVKSYHRRWHRGHGRYSAAMRIRELVPADTGPMTEPCDLVSLFGSPGFVYIDFLYFASRWVRAVVRHEDSFFYANKLRHIRSYLRTRREQRPRKGFRAAIDELIGFVAKYRRKRSTRALAN
jgi:glycosyltransferase involved in cell wall biosynthesis